MSEETKAPAPAGNRPSHTVWFAPKREHARWTAIGSLWPTRNGQGFNMVLELVPRAEGNLVIRPYVTKDSEAETAEA